MSNDSTLDQARKAKDAAKVKLKSIQGISGIGITRVDRGYGLKVNLSEPLGAQEKVPETIDGVPVKVEVVGKIKKR